MTRTRNSDGRVRASGRTRRCPGQSVRCQCYGQEVALTILREVCIESYCQCCYFTALLNSPVMIRPWSNWRVFTQRQDFVDALRYEEHGNIEFVTDLSEG